MLRAGMYVLAAWIALGGLWGCASKGRPAPVEDRTLVMSGTSTKAMPGSENAGKTGFYTVKPGDTLIRIGMDHGQTWRDLVRWNGLDNPNLIETGQVLRVAPPAQESGVVVRPVLPSAPVTPIAAAPVIAAAAKPVASSPQAPASPVPAPVPAASDVTEDMLAFKWPTRGNLIAGFDEVKNKGLDIAGKAGDPVLAAADGRVVYAGSGLRGYGNLIILKHNNTYLTAYAHNQTLLVKEDQAIKQGQKIAEMGNSDADQVKLHFEIRRQGKPVDPAKYLPAN
jgi:lipoprotein NlpD